MCMMCPHPFECAKRAHQARLLDRTQGKQQKLFSNYNTPALTQHKNNKNYAQSIRSDVQTARGRENERGRVSEFGTANNVTSPNNSTLLNNLWKFVDKNACQKFIFGSDGGGCLYAIALLMLLYTIFGEQTITEYIRSIVMFQKQRFADKKSGDWHIIQKWTVHGIVFSHWLRTAAHTL